MRTQRPGSITDSLLEIITFWWSVSSFFHYHDGIIMAFPRLNWLISWRVKGNGMRERDDDMQQLTTTGQRRWGHRIIQIHNVLCHYLKMHRNWAQVTQYCTMQRSAMQVRHSGVLKTAFLQFPLCSLNKITDWDHLFLILTNYLLIIKQQWIKTSILKPIRLSPHAIQKNWTLFLCLLYQYLGF